MVIKVGPNIGLFVPNRTMCHWVHKHESLLIGPVGAKHNELQKPLVLDRQLRCDTTGGSNRREARMRQWGGTSTGMGTPGHWHGYSRAARQGDAALGYLQAKPQSVCCKEFRDPPIGDAPTVRSEMRILLVAAIQGPNALFCMPNRTECVPSVMLAP
jgi:hypothetical protein